MEKQQAKERARQQKKKRAEELAQIRAYKKEEELVAKEVAPAHWSSDNGVMILTHVCVNIARSEVTLPAAVRLTGPTS